MSSPLVEQMRALKDSGDPEIAHGKADDLLVAALRSLAARAGLEDSVGELIDAWDDVPKWYA